MNAKRRTRVKNKGLGLLAMAVLVCGFTIAASVRSFAITYYYCIDAYATSGGSATEAYNQCNVQCTANQLSANCDAYCASLLDDGSAVTGYANCMEQAATEAQMNYCDNVSICVSGCDTTYYLCMNAALGEAGQSACGDQYLSCRRSGCHEDTCQR